MEVKGKGKEAWIDGKKVQIWWNGRTSRLDGRRSRWDGTRPRLGNKVKIGWHKVKFG